jgi:hypothetical protein
MFRALLAQTQEALHKLCQLAAQLAAPGVNQVEPTKIKHKHNTKCGCVSPPTGEQLIIETCRNINS